MKNNYINVIQLEKNLVCDALRGADLNNMVKGGIHPVDTPP